MSVLERLHTEREQLLATVDQVTSAAEDGDRDLSDAERELIARHQTRIADELDPQLDQLEAIERTRNAHQRGQSLMPAPAGRTAPPDDGDVEVYRTFAQYARDVLVTRYDAIAQLAGHGARDAAAQRISRVLQNTTTTTADGLIPRQYITEILQVVNKNRPIVESARKVALTSGKLSYPSITQRPIVGKQTAEKTELPSQSMNVAWVDVVADTYGGAGDLSWQAVNWSTPDALKLWFDLCAEAYARQTEAAAGSVIIAGGSTIPVASDDLEGWLAAITEAAGVVYSTSGRMADTVWADVATGYKLAGIVSQSSPVFLPGGGFSLATGKGSIVGLDLVLSKGLRAPNVVVGDSQALLVAETAGAPIELRAVEPSIAGFQVGVVGAFVAKIVDTGAFAELTPPA